MIRPSSSLRERELQAALKLATPATLAATCSRDQWKLAPHLELIDRKIMALIRREVPERILLIETPPRHGKSEMVAKYTTAWHTMRFPTKRVLLSSYEADFARGWGRRAREVVDEYGAEFGVHVSKEQSAANDWEVTPGGGGMATAGVGGPLTGKGGDLMVFDDLVKNAEQAQSATFRESAWDWLQSTFLTRREPNAVVVGIGTRWHDADPMGRLIAHAESGNGEPVLRVRLPALAEDDDPLGRAPGEALWPERYPVEELERMRATMSERWWSALYGQNPTPAEGGMFKREWFKIIPLAEVPRELFTKGTAVRYWDCAATHGAGDYTVGVLMVKYDGVYYVLDACRGQWSPHQRKEKQRAACKRDVARFKNYRTWQEEEPGSAGKDAAAMFVRDFSEFRAATQRATGSKETRAMDWSDELEAGNVRLIRADWNAEYIDEHAAFPAGAHDDQVDASSGAFNKCQRQRTFAVGAAPKDDDDEPDERRLLTQRHPTLGRLGRFIF